MTTHFLQLMRNVLSYVSVDNSVVILSDYDLLIKAVKVLSTIQTKYNKKFSCRRQTARR